VAGQDLILWLAFSSSPLELAFLKKSFELPKRKSFRGSHPNI